MSQEAVNTLKNLPWSNPELARTIAEETLVSLVPREVAAAYDNAMRRIDDDNDRWYA